MSYNLTTTDKYSLSSEFALALIGEPFTGKTCLACELMPENSVIVNLDRKLGPAMNRVKGKRFYVLDPAKDDKGASLPLDAVFDNTVVALAEIARNNKCKGIIIDSVSELSVYLERKLVSLGGSTKDLIVGGEKCMTMNLWNPFKDIMRKFILATRATGLPCVFIFHELLVETESGGVNGIRPLIGGQLKNSVTKWFTDSWRLFTKTVTYSVDPSGQQRCVRTEPLANLQQLGHSAASLPHEIVLDAGGKGLAQLKAAYSVLCETPSGS